MALVPHRYTAPLTQLGDVTVEEFLRSSWQRQPCLLRQVFPGFEPPLDENDIAGLACDELAEARLVTGSYPAHDWTVRHGPFEAPALADLPARDWTLLVQDVEKHYPPLQSLLARFAFLPTWRLDDLMVSVSAPGASVGPHVDQYDVFLLQASGDRRWDIATTFDPERLPDCELDVLRRFDAAITWELGPGDILYLPPGVAHHGIALNTGMTWSVGLRSPSQADLFAAYAEWLADRRDEGHRYTDGPELRARSRHRPGEIASATTRRMRGLMRPGADLDSFLGEFLTGWRLAHRPAEPRRPLAAERLSARLAAGAVLRRNPWTRMAWQDTVEGSAHLFAAGEAFVCRAADAALLCTGDAWCSDGVAPSPALLALITGLVNRGHLYLD